MPGYYKKEYRIKSSAKPIDNIEKFAWDDDDYEEYEEWHEYTEEELSNMNRKSPLDEMSSEYDQAICELYEMLVS